MVRQESTLVMLVQSVDTIPLPEPPVAPRRGRPLVYADRLFLKGLVVMSVKRLSTVYELLSVLAQDTPEMAALRPLLTEQGQCPSRRTWERRVPHTSIDTEAGWTKSGWHGAIPCSSPLR